MIGEIGLEDCGEIIALASTQQIEQVFDEDLWRASKPGSDETFNADRFGLWIEILMELGSASAADKIAEMDSDFITMAISQLVWVIDFESLRTEVASENRLEKIMESTYFLEVEDFVIFSREPRTWDAVVSLLTELDRDHHVFLRGVLENCVNMTTEQIDDAGGLYSVLTSEERLKEDVAFEREKRREAQGFVTPADARAFIKLASGPIDAEDHISPKKFRDSNIRQHAATPDGMMKSQGSIGLNDRRFENVQKLLTADPTHRHLRMEELNYLANILVSGWEVSGRPPRPGEAAAIVLEACEKGLKKKPALESFVDAFRAGWTKKICDRGR